jgi:hypothetical protein
MSILFDLYTFIVKNQNSFNEKSVIIHDDRGFESPWVPEPGRRNFGDNIPRCIPVDEVIKVLKNVKADDFKSFEEAHIIMKKANERGICK